jgi:hypothetical protein
MNRENLSCDRKKQWEKPKLVNLSVESTEFGGGSVLSDVSNTSSATRTS